MLEATIVASGKDLDAVLLAIDEARKRIADGFSSGHDSNDSGRFRFNLTGVGATYTNCSECRELIPDEPDEYIHHSTTCSHYPVRLP